MRLNDWQKNVCAGLTGGLLVYFAIAGIEEAIKQELIGDVFAIKIFGVLIFSVLIYLLFIISNSFKNFFCNAEDS